MRAETGIFFLIGKNANLANYQLIASAGNFTFTGIEAILTINTSIAPSTGTFLLEGSYAAIYRTDQLSYVIDNLAAAAPCPATFFVPVMQQTAPIVVLSPDVTFGATSGNVYAPIYLTYYNPDLILWDDAGYQRQNPGQSIPGELKQAVADQTCLYNQYLIANAAFITLYAQEKEFQWPYFWARNVIARS